MINKNGDSDEPPFLLYVGESVFQQDIHNLTSSLGNRSTRAEDGYYASLVQEVIVLCRDYTTGKHEDVFAAELLEFFHQLRNQGLVTSSQ